MLFKHSVVSKTLYRNLQVYARQRRYRSEMNHSEEQPVEQIPQTWKSNPQQRPQFPFDGSQTTWTGPRHSGDVTHEVIPYSVGRDKQHPVLSLCCTQN